MYFDYCTHGRSLGLRRRVKERIVACQDPQDPPRSTQDPPKIHHSLLVSTPLTLYILDVLQGTYNKGVLTQPKNRDLSSVSPRHVNPLILVPSRRQKTASSRPAERIRWLATRWCRKDPMACRALALRQHAAIKHEYNRTAAQSCEFERVTCRAENN